MKAIDLEIGKIYLDEDRRTDSGVQHITYFKVLGFEDKRNKIYIDEYMIIVGIKGSAMILHKDTETKPTNIGLVREITIEDKRKFLSLILELKSIIS